MSIHSMLPKTIGLGTMELCITPARPSEREAVTLLTELVEQHELRLIDTADAYCNSEADFGYGEAIIRSLAQRGDVLVATKGGFTRPGGTWKPKGDPAYLRSACEASLKRMGIEQIALYQYHTPDPAVPFEDSVGELIKLKEEGKIAEIGLSNVSLVQLKVAMQLTSIATVQNPLSVVFYDPDEHDAMLRYCEEQTIAFLAYAPLGGFRNRGMLATASPALLKVSEANHVTVFQLALMYLTALSHAVVPIPGTTTHEHAIENLAVQGKSLPAGVFDEIEKILEAQG